MSFIIEFLIGFISTGVVIILFVFLFWGKDGLDTLKDTFGILK